MTLLLYLCSPTYYLDGTEIYDASEESFIITLDQLQIELPCKARTDRSTNLTLTWYKGIK